MSREPNFDAIARAWLADGPAELSDRVLDAVLEEVHVTRQRRGLRALARRIVPVRLTPLLTGAIAVAVVVVALAGIVLLNRPADVAAPETPSPSAAPVATPTAAPSATPPASTSGTPTSPAPSIPGGTFGTGALPAGTYHSTSFVPHVILTLPAGWTKHVDDAELLWLSHGTTDLAFHFLGAAATAEGVAKTLVAGGVGALDQPPVAVTLGTVSGFAAERPGTTTGNETIFYKPGLQPYDAAAGSRVRAWVVDVGGRPVTISLIAPAVDYDTAVAEVTAFLQSLAFAP